jgi:calcineurin-like phosphoesterase family protein
LHLGHKNILLYEPIRLEYLMDFNADVIDECSFLLNELSEKNINEIKKDDLSNKILNYLIGKHDDMLIEKWNSVIENDDCVLFQGDFTFNKHSLAHQLNGKKIILRGNHDNKSDKFYLNSGWDYIVSNIIVDNENEKLIYEDNPLGEYCNGIFVKNLLEKDILFSHYPIFNKTKYDNEYQPIVDILEEIFNELEFNFNIYGHTHSKKSIFENSINVSVETLFSMVPQKLENILKLAGF